MKAFLRLFIARNKEFYRDKGSLSWAFLFPVLVIIGCAVAFSDDNKELFSIGYYPSTADIDTLPSLTGQYSKVIAYDDLEKAKHRLKHHQLHAVFDTKTQELWVNPASTESRLIEDIANTENNQYRVNIIEGKSVRYVDWVIPGVLGMNIMFGSLFGVGYVLVRYRKNGVLKRLQASPINAFTFLSAQVASRLFIVVTANAAIFIGADIFLDLLVVGSRWDLLLVSLCGAMSLISIGLLIASRTDSEELAGGILNTATWPMMFLSGIWFSLDETPVYMQQFANCLPLTHLVDAARDIMINGASIADVSDHLLIMIAMGLFSLAGAASLFKWHR